jgi:hypothetical protein
MAAALTLNSSRLLRLVSPDAAISEIVELLLPEHSSDRQPCTVFIQERTILELLLQRLLWNFLPLKLTVETSFPGVCCSALECETLVSVLVKRDADRSL